MKLAFSTLACPNWKFTEVFSTAMDFCYNGIEIRGLENEMFAPAIKIFDKDHIDATIKLLKNGNIEISCLTSGACLAVHSEKETALSESKDYIDLAERLNVKFVRVMSTSVPHKDGGDIELAKNLYTEICEYGKNKGVTPLMETNGMFVDSNLLKTFMEEIPSENKGILWDINHPYRFNGESVEHTLNNVKEYVKYVHIKDSKVENGGTVYKMTGYGDLPIKDAIKGLKFIKYDGYLSLEWVKRWNNNLPEPGVVIPLYIGFMTALIKN